MMLLSLAAAAAGLYTAPVPVHKDTWISPALDFPVRGVKADALNVVVVELTVNPYGGMSDCQGRATHGNPNMAGYVCDVLKNRTTFKPARDPAGKRMWGVYRQTFVWWLADKAMPPENYDRPANFQLEFDRLPPGVKDGAAGEIQFVIDTAGNGSSCSPTEANSDPAFMQMVCERLSTRLHFPPAKDRAGRPVPSVQNAWIRLGLSTTSK